MEFKRARNKEQYQFRKLEIINCAVKIYEDGGYEALNFSRISEITNFTRPTIYKYFATKEEIMLSLVIKYMDELIAYVNKEIEIIEVVSPEDLGNILTKSILIVPEFMNCYSILYSVLERNSSIKALTIFKTEMISRQEELLNIIHGIYSDVSRRNVHDFLIKYFAFASGLYPMCIRSDAQKEAEEISGFKEITLSFTACFEPVVFSMLEEMKA